MENIVYCRAGNKKRTNWDEITKLNTGYSEGDMLKKLEGQEIITDSEKGEIVKAVVLNGKIVEKEELDG